MDAAITGLHVDAVDAIPGIAPLAARLSGDSHGMLLEVPDQETRIDNRKLFRKPFELTHFGGDVTAWKDDDGWRIGTHQYRIESRDFMLSLRGGAQLQTDGSRPLMDLAAVVTRGNVEAAKLFWPKTMPESTVKWLDRALEEGDIVAGRAMIHGDLDNWPFNDNAGRFEAHAELSALKLAYLPDWPVGEDLDVSTSFINNGMQATAHSGRSLGVTIDETEASIADFHEPVLELSVDGHGAGKDLLAYLRATPVGEDHVSTLSGLAIGGNAVVHVDLDIPLKHHEQSTLDGKVDLSDADLDESTWDLNFKKANGQVRFTRTGVVADSLVTTFEEFPVTLGIAIGSSTSDSSNSFEARLHGILPASAIFARASELAPALPRFPGEAEWRVGLDIGADNGAAIGRKTLSVSSDLKGIAINLPAPLEKAADTSQAFFLNLQMPPLGQPFSASLGDIVQIDGRLPSSNSPIAANLALGPNLSPVELPASGLRIGGHAKTFDVSGWIALFSAGGGGGDLLNSIMIDVDDVSLAGRHFADLHLDLRPKDDAIKINVAGKTLEGEISVPSEELRRRGITAQMKRVHWPDLSAGTENSPTVLAGVAPASIPPLHLSIGELKLGTTDFGDMRVESYPTDEGMRIDLLETKSANLDMRASGDWIGTAETSHSRLDINMTAESLGKMLDTFGFAGIIEGGQTVAHIDATFPGSPATFALANATGSLNVRVEKGRILDVEPGAGGRLFGLLSLREIPRRLSLDFSDLFKSGMSFNSIKGSFTLDAGNARTDDLRIASPAADITISGRTGLRSKDYDQEMVVTPRAGVALPVVGALAGGPVGAAAGLFVQTLIGKKLNRAARSRYHVTGSWDKPVIALIAKEKFDAEAVADSPRGDSGERAPSHNQPFTNPETAQGMVDPVQAVIDALP
ncbi:MAG: YhdP family protein, partial [Dokdonella sp.]